MNRLPAQRRQEILQALCEGMSQRSCARIFGVDLKTVVKLFREAGDWAIAHMNSVEGLTVRRIEADELLSFVGNKRFVQRRKPGRPSLIAHDGDEEDFDDFE